MGALLKLIDIVLFLIFAQLTVFVLLLTSQECLPLGIYPTFRIDLKNWYITELNDYLFMEKPFFFIALIWHELLFLCPLSIANIYAILAGKPWFGITCSLYEASFVTSVAVVLGDMIGTRKASNGMILTYVPFLGFGILAIIRGLVSPPTKSTGAVLVRKKLT